MLRWVTIKAHCSCRGLRSLCFFRRSGYVTGGSFIAKDTHGRWFATTPWAGTDTLQHDTETAPAVTVDPSTFRVPAATLDQTPPEPGLYIVGTPIGNLEDISFRALRILKTVSLILAEDTRHTRKLLNYFGITTHMLSYHEHNEQQRQEEVLQRLQNGEVGLHCTTLCSW